MSKKLFTDAATNKALSYNLSTNMKLDLAINTLHKDVYIHSAQGVHYTSPQFQSVLKKYKIGQSMSRRGNCWDNAPQDYITITIEANGI